MHFALIIPIFELTFWVHVPRNIYRFDGSQKLDFVYLFQILPPIVLDFVLHYSITSTFTPSFPNDRTTTSKTPSVVSEGGALQQLQQFSAASTHGDDLQQLFASTSSCGNQSASPLVCHIFIVISALELEQCYRRLLTLHTLSPDRSTRNKETVVSFLELNSAF